MVVSRLTTSGRRALGEELTRNTQANAMANLRDMIEPHDLPITKGSFLPTFFRKDFRATEAE